VRTVPLAPTGAYATETVNTAAIPDGRTELPSPEIASVSDHYGAFLCVWAHIAMPCDDQGPLLGGNRV